MITRHDGTIYPDHEVERAALVHRTDDCKAHPERMQDWPIGDLLELVLAGRWLDDNEPLERAMLEAVAHELHAVRAAIELGEPPAGEGDGYAQPFAETHAVRLLDVLTQRTHAGLLLAERLADARRRPAPAPKPYKPIEPLGPVMPVTPIPDIEEAR